MRYRLMPHGPWVIGGVLAVAIHNLRAEVFVCINEVHTKGNDEFVELAAFSSGGVIDAVDLAVYVAHAPRDRSRCHMWCAGLEAQWYGILVSD